MTAFALSSLPMTPIGGGLAGDRDHPQDELNPVADVGPLEDSGQVGADGGHAEVQFGGDLLVAHAPQQQLDDPGLLRRQAQGLHRPAPGGLVDGERTCRCLGGARPYLGCRMGSADHGVPSGLLPN